VGSTIGLGIYVLSGQVASSKAGPAIILSYFIAGATSLLAALCYAEFGSLVPKAGSAYIYSYITVGEFMAFVIGWNLVLENMIGAASLARGYSGYIDSLVKDAGWSFQDFFHRHMPMNISQLSAQPDFLAFGIMFTMSIIMCFGVKKSTGLNTVFTIVNLTVVVYLLVVGCFKIDLHNWALLEEEVPHETVNERNLKPKNGGKGGFFPFGLKGMMEGAATLFYTFIGFDHVCSTGEEAKNPRKSVPRAISMALGIVFIAYTGVAAVQTLIWPYWDQNVDAPFAYIFTQLDWPVAKYAISVSAVLGLSTCLLGVLFALPRIFYAMASDGLIYRFLGKVHPKTQCPVIATLLSGFIAGFLSAIFDVKQLADMSSIGTLLAYSLVANSIAILRYSPHSNELMESIEGDVSSTHLVLERGPFGRLTSKLLNFDRLVTPTKETKKTSIILITVAVVAMVIMDSLLVFAETSIYNRSTLAIAFLVVSVTTLVACLISLSRQPQAKGVGNFRVPLVPFVPFISMSVNVYLMMNLSAPTWYRFGIWMVIGFFIYFTYGIFNSTGYMSEDNKDSRMKGNKKQSIENSPSYSTNVLVS
jgi:amino acid transporter